MTGARRLAVRATATLRLAAVVMEVPVSVDELARASGTDSGALTPLLRHPACHGVFTEPSPVTFDRNEVAALLCSDHPSGMRVQLDLDDFVGQSFFDPLPTGGDVYVLSGVIHDWGGDEATSILRRCAAAAGDGGRVVLLDGHGTDCGDRALGLY